jgi:hypothetical protein
VAQIVRLPAEDRTRRLVPQDFVKVEKNLSSLGFFTPSKSRGKVEVREKTIRFKREVDGKIIEAEATILPSAKYGLPITADQDKYLAFQKLVNDIRQRDGKVNNPIGFTSTELLRVLGIKDAGNNYADVVEWLNRMTLTGISSKGVVYFARKKSWATDTFHVFDRVITLGMRMPDGTEADRNYVWLSEWQLENINNNYMLPVDLEVYRKLRNNIAKALVPLLQVWLYASRFDGRFEKRYEDLCAILDIIRQQHLSQIKRQLQPSLDELQFHGYISGWKIELTNDGADYKIVADHGEKFFRDQKLKPASSLPGIEAPPPPRDESPCLVKALADRGLNESQARRLLKSLPAGRPVMQQLLYGDWLISRSKTSIQNPPGFYTYLLRENVRPPASFDEPKPADPAADAQYYDNLRLEAEYKSYCRQHVMRYIASNPGAAEHADLVGKKSQTLKKSFPRMPDATLAELAEVAAQSDIEKKLPLMSFEAFCRRNSQIELFVT